MGKMSHPALIALLTLSLTAIANDKADAMVSPAAKLGSKGPEIADLQFRLQTLGYFGAAPTSYFGPVTSHAVRLFQRHFGLTVDGIAGRQTWSKLKKVSVNKKELSMLARVIYGEARGESFKGQIAVGAVVMNRLQSPKFPKTVKGVIMQPKAFSAVKDGQYWLLPNQTAFKAARAAVKGIDPTGNALFYYNPDIVGSTWLKTRTATKQIGNHLFLT